ncbi:hypothetical protein HY637_04245 [Candidatus Woesearchaeota archaeon]|nr:hypothetical protein [Candidatus Woesearchaeota archaeon]
MDIEHTDTLLDELILRLDSHDHELYRSFLRAILDKTQIRTKGKVFAEISPLEDVLVLGSGKFPSDSVRMTRVIRNSQVTYHELTKTQNVVDALLLYIGSNSDVWLRRLMSDQTMVRLMHSSHSPYSLLAEHSSYEESAQMVVQMPLIIIPNIRDEAIYAWENKQAVYRRKGVFGIPLISTDEKYLRGYLSNTPSETSPARWPPQTP